MNILQFLTCGAVVLAFAACGDDASSGAGGGGTGGGGTGGAGSTTATSTSTQSTASGGTSLSALCTEVCKCDPTPDAGCEAECTQDADALQQDASAAGCQAEFDAYVACLNEHGACTGTGDDFDSPECTDEEDAIFEQGKCLDTASGSTGVGGGGGAGGGI